MPYFEGIVYPYFYQSSFVFLAMKEYVLQEICKKTEKIFQH